MKYMKYKTTAKAVRDGYSKIISIGYCEAQYLLRGLDEVAYTCGIYGWNFDVYEFRGIAICTGYRGMPQGVKYDYERLRFFDRKAEEICKDSKIPYERQVRMLDELRRDFSGEVFGGNE